MVGKKFQIIFSPISKERLKEISDYHKKNTSPAIAQKIRTEILSAARKLEKLPASKPKLPGTEELNYTIRYTKIWSYKIIFRVLSSESRVRILTIRHDKEDPQRIEEDLQTDVPPF